MEGLGVVNHERVGADLLRELGFSDRVTKLVEAGRGGSAAPGRSGVASTVWPSTPPARHRYPRLLTRSGRQKF